MADNDRLPADLKEVWGDSRFAHDMVAIWGVDKFRDSGVHRLALLEHQRVPKAKPKQGRK